jgi:hypothetical protein
MLNATMLIVYMLNIVMLSVYTKRIFIVYSNAEYCDAGWKRTSIDVYSVTFISI